jgi:hypothetical protein
MFKYFLGLVLLTYTLYAQIVHFSEEKYFESLEMIFYKKGKITFLKNQMQIIYTQDNTILTYRDNLLIKQKGSTKTELDLRKKPEIKMFFVLFEAIYFDKKKILLSYFKFETTDGITTLIPNENIARYIGSVSYKKKGKHLAFLKINMTNRDWILIEENH